MARNSTVNAGRFGIVPRFDIPRSVFKDVAYYKSIFDASYLIPVFVEEVVPGDTWRINMTAFCRLTPPIYPIMDDLYLDSFWFFCPWRLVWENWKKFMGEQLSPGDSTAYLTPTVDSPVGGFAVGSFYDYLGLPTVGQVDGAGVLTVNNLYARAYRLIWREWFRDQNLQLPSTGTDVDDGPDTLSDYTSCLVRAKRPDYFTTCLPWPEKPAGFDASGGYQFLGGVPVSGLGTLSLASEAAAQVVYETGGTQVNWQSHKLISGATADRTMHLKLDADGYPDVRVAINQMRLALSIQLLLERDARGGTRYTEKVRSQFGVTSPDARQHRPEYIGGGSSPITFNPIFQTSATGLTGGTTGLGHPGASATGIARNHSASYSATEHGCILGIVNVRSELSYQQGVHRRFSRRTQFDYYTPALANLGEQAVLRKELYAMGLASDDTVFGYQERWSEYRYFESRITGLMRSYVAGTLDAWHLAEKFTAAPTLSAGFIASPTTSVLDRVLQVPSSAGGKQILFDARFDITAIRPLPAFSIPGLGSRF